MRFVQFAAAFAVVLVILSIGYASAQEAANDTRVVVGDLIAPWLEMLVGAVAVLITAILGWIAAQVKAKTGIDIEARHREALQTALTNAAGLALTRLSTTFGSKTIDVKHPLIKQAVEYVNSAVPDAIRNFGLTPEQIAEKIVAKVGLAQAPSLEADPGVSG